MLLFFLVCLFLSILRLALLQEVISCQLVSFMTMSINLITVLQQ